MKRYIPLVSPGFLSFLGLFSPLGRDGISNITLSPFIISREPMSELAELHEAIHVYQQQECSALLTLILLPFMLLTWWMIIPIIVMWLPFLGPFYWAYAFFYFRGLVKYRRVWEETNPGYTWFKPSTLGELAYFQIPFEQEAYDKEDEEDYLKRRKLFAWVRYRV